MSEHYTPAPSLRIVTDEAYSGSMGLTPEQRQRVESVKEQIAALVTDLPWDAGLTQFDVKTSTHYDAHAPEPTETIDVTPQVIEALQQAPPGRWPDLEGAEEAWAEAMDEFTYVEQRDLGLSVEVESVIRDKRLLRTLDTDGDPGSLDDVYDALERAEEEWLAVAMDPDLSVTDAEFMDSRWTQFARLR